MSDPQSTDPAPPLPGLSEEEAGRRRAAGQGNDVQIRTGRTYGRIVRDNVFNFINNLFYVLGVVLLALGKPLDAFVVVFVILANTVISLIQEVRAKRVMDRIAILMRPKASVVREGLVQDLDPAQVVLGDVLYLHPGDQVVVDGSMVGEGRMEVDESLLTGESDLVTKHSGDALLSGSFCMTGGGYYEAQKVGLESFANKLTAKATEFKRELTPLQRQINQIVRVLLLVVVVFEILVWVRNTIGGVPFVESVRMSTVVLALIPNGLVLSIALTYALGAERVGEGDGEHEAVGDERQDDGRHAHALHERHAADGVAHPREDLEDDDHEEQHAHDLVDLPLQRCELPFELRGFGRELVGEALEADLLGLVVAAAGHAEAAREQGIAGVLGHEVRFAGEQRLVDLHAALADHRAIDDHLVAGVQVEDLSLIHIS